MKTIYLPQKKDHWSFNTELHNMSVVHGLARRVKARKRVNTVLGACLLAASVGREPGEVLAEAGRVGVSKSAGRVKVEL